MKISLLLAAVIALPACSSPSPARSDPAPDASSAAPVDSGALTAPSARLAVVTPTGDLCVLDGATGAVRSRQPARAADLAADEDHPGRLATVEPSDGEAPGRLARYRLRADRLELLAALPFDAPDGRLLRAGDALVGLARSELTTLFWARDGEGPGQVWGPVAAAAALVAGDAVRVQTAGLPEAHAVTLRTALVDERGVRPGEVTGVSAPGGAPALFALPSGFGRVDATPGGWRVVGSPHDGFQMEAPGEFPVAARLLDDGRRLAVLTGPAARLRVLSVWGVGEAALGGERLAPPDGLAHRLGFDAGRQRVWALAGGRAYAVALPSMAVVATGECTAIGLAVVTPDE